MCRFQFVAENSTTYPVKRLCELVEIERFLLLRLASRCSDPVARAVSDAELLDRIRVIHGDDDAQGVPRITAELNDGAVPERRVNHKRVARVMRAASLRGFVKKRRPRTTVPEPADQVVPDLLGRDFTADAPNARYVGDITYLPLSEAGGSGTCISRP